MISKKKNSNTEVKIEDYVRKISPARNVSLFLIDLVYPNICPCCQKPIPWNQYLCDVCEEEIPLPEDVLCPGCAKPFSECRCSEASYSFGFALAEYGGAARSGVLAMKQAKSRAFSWYCAGKLTEKIVKQEHFLTYDYVVPVPMKKRKKRERIINPAEVFAREMSRLL